MLSDTAIKMALVRADMKGKEVVVVVGEEVKKSPELTTRPAKRMKKSGLGEVEVAVVGDCVTQTGVGNTELMVPKGESGGFSEGELEAMLGGWGWLGDQPSGGEHEGDNTEVKSEGEATPCVWSTKKCALKDVFDSTLVPLTLFERRGDVPMVDQID